MTVPLHAAHPAVLAREHLAALGVGDSGVELAVDWAGPVRLPLTDEYLVRAACGIMHVHSRARGEPVPLAVGYATSVAALLAAQGGARRGVRAQARPPGARGPDVGRAGA
jgi:hypothetical protein